MAFILNRRAKLRASAIPVEIPDASTLVKKTDKATASKLGLVKIGDNVNISSGGAISVSDASSETKGLIKLGDGLSVNAETGAVDAVGGMTWTKIWEGAAAASSEKTFAEGIDALSHKLVIVATCNNSGATGIGFCLSELIGSSVNTVTLSINRLNETLTFTLKRTGFTMPSNMGADNLVVYVLD